MALHVVIRVTCIALVVVLGSAPLLVDDAAVHVALCVVKQPATGVAGCHGDHLLDAPMLITDVSI